MNEVDFKLDRNGGVEKITSAIYSPKSFRAITSVKKNTNISFKTILIICIVISMMYVFVRYTDKENGALVPMPDNGTVIQYQPIDATTLIAPFKVISNPSLVATHYLVLVSDWKTSAPIMAMFILGGREAQTTLPIGTYRISIAKGVMWYGMDHLFGKKTVKIQGARPISLYQSELHQTIGVTINLNETVNGNFPVYPGGLIVRK